MAPIGDSSQMSDRGLLVLSARNWHRFQALLAAATKSVRSRLYIRLEDSLLEAQTPQIYLASARQCPELDVRVLVGNNIPKDVKILDDEPLCNFKAAPRKYKKVVLGGTFDRLHNGHKVLLSKAAMIASESVTCGVTDKNMIIKKSLFEMIEPVEKRIADVVDFVEDIGDNLSCLAEPIENMYGPSTRVADLEAIVVSRETIKGADAVNLKRLEQGMTPLEVVIVELVEGSDEILGETKVSSSSRRREDLGRLLRPARAIPRAAGKPYVIGLTGGIASGKSKIAEYLKLKDDFDVIDCDKLAHTCYEPGSELSHQIAEHFGGDVVVDGVVDRKKLGAIVFADKARLRELSELVWPIVKAKAMQLVEASSKPFVVVEAAALVEAGWHNQLAEVWTVFVPVDEALRRVVQRDSLSEEQARARIESQISNKARIDASNIVFCSLWAYEETRAQVDRAVDELKKRIK